MKTFLSVVTIATTLSVGSALAADLPSRKGPILPPPPPPPLWTGFYAGLNAGATFGGNNSTNTSALPVFAAPTWGTELALSTGLATTALGTDNVSFIGGGQIGYNYQFANVWVAGIEADAQGLAANGNTTSGFGSGVPVGFPAERIVSVNSSSKSIDYLGTVRGRVGYLVTPTLLVYATGGLAYGGVNSSASIFQANLPFVPAFAAGGSFSDTRFGWTAGGGVEWLLTPNWSAKLEYLYYDLGNVSYALSPLAFTAYASAPFASTRFNGHIARVGLNYHFNLFAPAPVVAKY